MAVKDHVVLSSDGGSVTMGRRLAFYSYGRFEVVIPEGREQQVEDDRIQNGYIARNPGQKMGRFDFGFIRQDATINLEAQTSDLELAIDSTEKRSEGDVYVERDISRAGMNGFELGRDFSLDDIVRYRVWGNYLRLPVTAGDLESSVDGGLRGVRVHVGGQVASDSEARLRRNAEILGQLENEKRQRTRQVSKAQSTATSAKSTAEQAKQTADETAALVDGLDIDGSIQEARDAVDSSNAILQLVRQLTGAAAAQGAQAQASASLAIEYARQAEEVLDKLDPLRDDVVAAHAEVARLSGEAAKAAQQAAASVAQGERHVVAAQRAANAAAADADESQALVDEAKALLQELGPLQDSARKSLADAQDLLDNAGGSGRSLSDVLKDVAAKHQEVLSAHDDILATHGEILEIHGEAIRYAAMAAAQAGAAAMQASQAASEALRAADLNAQAIAALAEADEKLIEADRKLQEQIDVLEESQRLLAQAVRYVAAAAAQAAQAAMSAAQASEENSRAIAQTNIAVDAATDSIEALKGANKARDAAQEAQKADFEKAIKLQTAVNSKLKFESPKFLFWGDTTFKWPLGASSTVSGGGMKIEVTRVKDLHGYRLDVVKVSKTFAWRGSVAIDIAYLRGSSLLIKRPGYGAYDYDYQFGSDTANPGWSMRSFSCHLTDDAENNQVTIALPAYYNNNPNEEWQGGHLTVRCIAFPQDADIAAVTK